MFLSLGVLLAGHGLQLSLLPLHGVQMGFSQAEIGMTGSLYFAGFVTGCLSAARLLRQAGAIRTMMTLMVIMTGILLALESQGNLILWMLLRFVTGWSIAAIYATFEAWISETTETPRLGRMFSFYVVVTLIGMALGQSALGIFPEDSLFTVAAVLMLVAIVPIGIYCPDQPMTLEPMKFSLRSLAKIPAVALGGVGIVGLVTGCIWTLGPVIGQNRGLNHQEIALMMNAVVLGGMLCQIPFGWVADRWSRRGVIAITAMLGFMFSALIVLSSGSSLVVFLLLMIGFGGCSLSMYGLGASAGQADSTLSRIDTAAMLLLVHGVGSMLGPLLAGILAGYVAQAMFWLSGLAFAAIAILAFTSVPKVRVEIVPFEPGSREIEQPSLPQAA